MIQSGSQLWSMMDAYGIYNYFLFNLFYRFDKYSHYAFAGIEEAIFITEQRGWCVLHLGVWPCHCHRPGTD